MESKKPWESKTLWMNLIIAVAAMASPKVHDYIGAHPDVVSAVWAFANVVLRLVSKDKIQIKDDSGPKLS